MPDVVHRTLGPGEIHRVHDYVVANAAARTALSVVEADVGKVCRQSDDNSFWILARVTGGVLWTQIGGTSGGGGGTTVTYGAPVSVGTTNAEGTGDAVARATHVHAHGDLAGGTLHAAAVANGTAGFMTGAQAAAIEAATAAAAALRAPTYIVQSASGALDAERVLTGADGVTIDYGTAGQAIVRGPGTPAASAPVSAQYLVAATDATLTAERVLGGTAPVTVDYAAAGAATISVAEATGSVAGLMPATMWTTVNTAVSTSAGAADANKLVRLNGAGQVDATCLPVAATGSATSPTVGTGATQGTSTALARALHTHDHGNIGGTTVSGTYHGPATVSDFGFMTPTQVTALGNKANLDFSIVAFNGTSLTLTAAHRGALIVATYSPSPRIIIPRDSTTNLVIGFTCSVVLGAIGENSLIVESEVMTGTYGTPARNAPAYTSTGSTPYVTSGLPFQVMTLMKIGADSWIVTGHNVP